MNNQDRAAQVWDDLGPLNPENPQDDAIHVIATYGQERYRAGRVGGYKDGYRDAVKKLIRFMKEVTEVDEAANLLAEQEKK